MTLAQYARLAVRESRRSRGRIFLFMACIAVGVAAVVIVAGLSRSVEQGVRVEGRRLMAADLAVEGRRPLPAALNELLARQPGVQRTDVREFVSVIANTAGDQTQLAELKVVDGVYPFYGTLKLDPPNKRLAELLDAQSVVVATELLSKLNAKIGDELRIGGANFRIAGAVLEEPDKLSITFTLGPRVFMSSDGVARTALIDKGSRVEYRALLKMPEGRAARMSRNWRRRSNTSWKMPRFIACVRSPMRSLRCAEVSSGWGGTWGWWGCCHCSSAASGSRRWRGHG
jgi:putative ABC transport system permease protein